jgi:hypothetical protein
LRDLKNSNKKQLGDIMKKIEICLIVLALSLSLLGVEREGTIKVMGANTRQSRSADNISITNVENYNEATLPDELFMSLLADTLLPEGVEITEVTITGEGSGRAFGFYSNIPEVGGIKMANGIIITTGDAEMAAGPNTQSGLSVWYSDTPSEDTELENLANGVSYDAFSLAIEFVTTSEVEGFSFDFCFGSDEYPEFVGTDYNDIIAVFLDGENILYDKNDNLISINNAFFDVDNDTVKSINLEYDGFTSPLRTSKKLTPGKHTLRFAISDIFDSRFDSGIFLNNFRFEYTQDGTKKIEIEDHSFVVDDTTSAGYKVGELTLPYSSDSDVTLTIEEQSPKSDFILKNRTIEVAPGTTFDYYKDSVYTLEVRAHRDGDDSSDDDFCTVTINLNNIELNLNLVDDQTFYIDENLDIPSAIGDIVVSNDPDVNFKLVLHTITPEPHFTLENQTIRATHSIDYESDSLYSITVIAKGSGIVSDTAIMTIKVREYKQELSDLTIDASPSDPVVYYFGESIDTISLSTNFTEEVTIFWSMDTVAVDDSKLLETRGTLYNRETGFPSILSTSADTLYLSVMAQGDEYEPTTKTFKYVRQYLPEITATPEGGTKFSTDIRVELHVNDPDDRFENVRTHYTDSTVVDTAVDATYPIDSIIKLDTTRYISAVAYSDNAVKSPLFTGLYTQVATVSSAWYKDISGDGAIDAVKILLSKAVTTLPSTITVTSPFNSQDSQVIVASDIESISPRELEITLPEPLTFTGETGFEPALLGSIDGSEYLADDFLIDDSVAPVLISADYYTGAVDTIIEKEVVREIDTLVVKFSEDVAIEITLEPFVFTRPGLPYQMLLTRLSPTTETKQVSFLVDSLVGVVAPIKGDSLQITPTGIITDGEVAQTNSSNRMIPLIVHEPPYLLIIRAISPVDPDRYTIPLELQSATTGKNTGLVMIADFMTELWDVENLDASVKIFDALGNVVVESKSFGSDEHIDVELLTTPRTRIVFIWDGRNKFSRRVGNGAYIAAISITLPDGKKMKKRIAIGVKALGLGI